MILSLYEKDVLQFLLNHHPETSDIDVDELVVQSRFDNGYAKTLGFAHSQNERDVALLSRIGGEYYLMHPKRDDVVEVLICLANNVPISAEFVPLGLNELPKDLEDFELKKVD